MSVIAQAGLASGFLLATMASLCFADEKYPNLPNSLSDRQKAYGGPLTQTLTVKSTLRAGTIVRPEDLVKISLPANELPEAPVQEADEIEGLVTKRLLEPGIPLSLTYFTNELGVIEQLPVQAGRRAVSIRVDERTSIEGHAIPGSHVDVVITFVDSSGNLKSSIIAENARVLSYGGHTKEQERLPNGKPQVADTITLDVSEPEALKILTANRFALMSLIMRAPEDDRTVGDIEQTVRELEKPVQAQKTEHDSSLKDKTGRYCPSTPKSKVPVGTLRFSPRNRVTLRLPFFDDCTPRSYIP